MMEERFIRYCVDLMLLPHDTIVRQRGEFVWDYQGDWNINNSWNYNIILGPSPYPNYKMKKQFSFITMGKDWSIEFGWSHGYNPPITRNETFRFRCACSIFDVNYVSKYLDNKNTLANTRYSQ